MRFMLKYQMYKAQEEETAHHLRGNEPLEQNYDTNFALIERADSGD